MAILHPKSNVMKLIALLGLFVGLNVVAFSQTSKLTGTVKSEGANFPLKDVKVEIQELKLIEITDEQGVYAFENVAVGTYHVHFTGNGFMPFSTEVELKSLTELTLDVHMSEQHLLPLLVQF